MLNTQRNKNLKRQAKAFKCIEGNVRAEALTQRNKASAFLQKIREKIELMTEAVKEQHKLAKSKSISRWYNKTILWKKAKTRREALQKRKA